MFSWFQGVISCTIKPKKFFLLVFLVEFQLYFTGFFKVYVTVLLLKKYLTSTIEKNIWHGSFFQFYEPPDLGKKIFTTLNVLKSQVCLTCINFWKFHDDLKACLEVIKLSSWPENVKISVKMQFFTYSGFPTGVEDMGGPPQTLMGVVKSKHGENMGELKIFLKKYLWRSSFDSKVAGYKPASLQIY